MGKKKRNTRARKGPQAAAVSAPPPSATVENTPLQESTTEQVPVASVDVEKEAEVEQALIQAEKEAEAEAEQARIQAEKEAQEKAEQEAEEARIQAEKEAEEARIQAEKEAEEARIQAEKEAEEARIQAEKEAEEARIQAEKEAEEARIQAEKEAKQKVDKEAKEAHIQAEKDAKEEAEKEAKNVRIQAEKEQQEQVRILAEQEATKKAEGEIPQENTETVTEESEGTPVPASAAEESASESSTSLYPGRHEEALARKQQLSVTMQQHIGAVASVLPKDVKASSSSAARFADRLRNLSSLKDVTRAVLQKGSSGRSLLGDVLFSGIYSLTYHEQAQQFVNTVLIPILATVFSIFTERSEAESKTDFKDAARIIQEMSHFVNPSDESPESSDFNRLLNRADPFEIIAAADHLDQLLQELLGLVINLNDEALLLRTLLKPEEAHSVLAQILHQSFEEVPLSETISLDQAPAQASGVWEKAVQHTRMRHALTSSKQARQFYKDELEAITNSTNPMEIACRLSSSGPDGRSLIEQMMSESTCSLIRNEATTDFFFDVLTPTVRTLQVALERGASELNDGCRLQVLSAAEELMHALTIDESDSSPLERILTRGDPYHVVSTSQQMRRFLHQLISGVMELPEAQQPHVLLIADTSQCASLPAAAAPSLSSNILKHTTLVSTPTAEENATATTSSTVVGVSLGLMLGVGALVAAVGVVTFFAMTRKHK